MKTTLTKNLRAKPLTSNSSSKSPQIKFLLLKKAWDASLKDLSVFLWGKGNFKGFVWTNDEQSEDETIKRFPDRKHLRAFVSLYEKNRLLIVFKSRQMQISWIMAAVVLWECLQPGRRWAVICKKFESADELLTRMWIIYNKLPENLRPPAKRKEGVITILHPDNPSIIQAAAQNPEDVRQYTLSGVWFDESAFHSAAAEFHKALVPSIQGRGRAVITTTPNGREFFFFLAGISGKVKEIKARLTDRFAHLGTDRTDSRNSDLAGG